jgi:hypothetical protein
MRVGPGVAVARVSTTVSRGSELTAKGRRRAGWFLWRVDPRELTH